MTNTLNLCFFVLRSSKGKVRNWYEGGSIDQQIMHTGVCVYLAHHHMNWTKNREGYQHLDCVEEEGRCSSKMMLRRSGTRWY